MNVNGSSYHLYLGREDWIACRAYADGDLQSLGEIWENDYPVEEQSAPPQWNDADASLTIAPLLELIPPTDNEQRLRVDDRRGLTADRNGNIYFVSDDLQSILVQGAGEDHSSRYWPDDRPCENENEFADFLPESDTRTFGSLAVTECDYLCAIAIDGDDMCMLRFDLVGGGPPEEFHYPDFAPEGLTETAAMPGGGLMLLDRQGERLVGLTTDMQLCLTETPSESESVFQPLEDDVTRTDKNAADIWQIDLSELVQPLCMVAISSHELLILDRVSEDSASLLLVDCDNGSRTSMIEIGFGALGLALLPKEDGTDRRRIMLWGPGGNQARAIDLRESEDGWLATGSTNLIPMRRFGGRGIVASGKRLYYDSGVGGPVWIPLMVQKRCRFAQSSSLITPPLDSDIFACVWDRIRMDAVIPAGASVSVEARAFDNLDDFESDDENSWILQPQPYLNGDRGEIPKLSLSAPQKTTARGEGCWDLLLQKLEGRYVQLRLTMAGDGRRSPSISAMRIWYPRFSYAERFLPALYSEDAISGNFTDRFLASIEGVNSVIEAKVVAAQYLLDPRFAPPEALDWLAGWFDIALDPAWDECRRRMFIKYAVKFLGWRGTLPGLRLALRLAFDPDITDCDFELPDRAGAKANGIRIVENFRTRRSGHQLGASRIDSTLRPLATISGARWSPAEGKSGLVERWARHLGQKSATPVQQMASFSLVADDYESEDWANFAMEQFGFVPQLGGQERKNWRAFQLSAGAKEPLLRQPVDGDLSEGSTWHEFAALTSRNQQYWQRFLRGKYHQIELLNKAWATKWTDFGKIALPDVLPETVTALEDWLMFEGQVVPMHRSAHRFSVLLPRRDTGFAPQREERELALAKRIIALEKPAHTIFDVRFFWAMNRLGEARLGYDTQIGAGSRAPQLIPPAILGRNITGAAFVGGPQNSQSGRERLAC